MKKAILPIVTLFTLFIVACNSNNSETFNAKDSTTVVNIKSDSVVLKPVNSSGIENKLISDSVIGIVYVQTKNGTVLRELIPTETKSPIALEFGTKLFVIATEQEANKTLKEDSNKIKVKFEKCEFGRELRYIGYVSANDVVDSLEADFSVIPTDYFFIDKYNLKSNNKGKLKFKFSPITSKEYNSYKLNYKKKIVKDTTKNRPDKQYFILNIAGQLKKFSYNNICEDWQHYMGYVKSLDSYEIEGCGNEACYTYLINKSTGKYIHLDAGPFIQNTSLPYLSKEETKFIVFTPGAMSGDNGTFMILYKKDQNTDSFDFSEYDSFFTEEWEVEDLVWINEQTIALKLTGGAGYLKGSILK